MFEFLFSPQDDINYNFIASLYGGGVIFAIVFAVLDTIYQMEEVKGFWIIFCPFVPALLWSLFMKSRAASLIKKQKGD